MDINLFIIFKNTMSFDTFQKSFSTNLNLSRDNKKDVLWNVI